MTVSKVDYVDSYLYNPVFSAPENHSRPQVYSFYKIRAFYELNLRFDHTKIELIANTYIFGNLKSDQTKNRKRIALI